MEAMMSSPTPTRNCEICSGGDFRLISKVDRKGQPLATVVCRGCGLVSHQDIPSPQQIDEFYARKYRQQYHGETTPSPRRVMRAWRNGQRILGQLRNYVRSDQQVLEIGAGIGCTVKAFEMAGYPASGIEPHEGFQRYGSRTLLAPVQQAYLGDLPAEPQADLILLVHVIEHFRSPAEALAAIRQLLNPNGYLYVECPNLEAPFAPPGKLFHYAHIYNFTPATLEMLAARCGYQLVQCFSGPRNPNLQMLFQRGRVANHIIPDSYGRTMDALGRYNRLTYHLRAGYLADRVRKLSGYFQEHCVAERFVRQLQARIPPAPQAAQPDKQDAAAPGSQPASSGSSPPSRRVA